MHFQYPDSEHFREAVPLVVQMAKTRDVPLDKAIHAGYVIEGYGFSFWPGQPAVFGAAEKYGEAEMLADLQDLADPKKFAAGDEAARAKALPWALIRQVLMAMIQKWLLQLS